jgi:hypothetical protein
MWPAGFVAWKAEFPGQPSDNLTRPLGPVTIQSVTGPSIFSPTLERRTSCRSRRIPRLAPPAGSEHALVAEYRAV